ncbi:DUF2249 domain-containing protein [Thermomonas alba]|uniref:DUF2249 domain-containing protein n=1 Tax=Thermomonas alba TaxID=2888525 RepID=UPI001F0492F8|nr:DUF2249 domain-containing protein [Thermomonas alba]
MAREAPLAAVIRLDLRSLPPPAPFQQALAAVDGLAPGQWLEVLTPLFPVPLLETLQQRGLRWSSQPCQDHGFAVVIMRP